MRLDHRVIFLNGLILSLPPALVGLWCSRGHLEWALARRPHPTSWIGPIGTPNRLCCPHWWLCSRPQRRCSPEYWNWIHHSQHDQCIYKVMIRELRTCVGSLASDRILFWPLQCILCGHTYRPNSKYSHDCMCPIGCHLILAGNPDNRKRRSANAICVSIWLDQRWEKKMK